MPEYLSRLKRHNRGRKPRPSTKNLHAFPIALVLLVALALSLAAAQSETTATTDLMDGEDNIAGTATLTAQGEGVHVQVELEGATVLSEGEHGIHFHENGTCSPDLDAAGAHFDPPGNQHGLENPE